MTYFQRTYQLQPLLGDNYKYESVVIGEDMDSLENSYKLVEEDLEHLLKLEREKNPVKTNVKPF